MFEIEMERFRILKEGSAERLAIHFLQTPIGIIEWNLAFQVLEWNPAAERILGYTRREVIGQHASVFYRPRDYIVVETSWKTVIGTVLPERSTTRNVTKQGNEIWCLWYSAPLRDTGGRVMGVLSMFEDVTTKRRIENSLHIYANAIRTAINPARRRRGRLERRQRRPRHRPRPRPLHARHPLPGLLRLAAPRRGRPHPPCG